MITPNTDNRLYFANKLRLVESKHQNLSLMLKAGTAAAEWAQTLVASTAPVLILAGPGNNGGDALVTAYHLSQNALRVEVVFMGNPGLLPDDALRAYRLFTEAGGKIHTALPADRTWSLVVDGLFGIGLNRAPEEKYADLIQAANTLAQACRIPLLALDCPSGLDTDTGFCPGAAIIATHTLSFIGGKPGLFTAEGPDHAGTVRIDNLELPPASYPEADGKRIILQDFDSYLTPRRYNSHKGSHGSVGIIGGAHSMLGAPLLSGRAAIKFGAGRVFLGLLDPQAPGVDFLYPELMLRRQESIFDAELDALACGPGMGRSVHAEELLERAISTSLPLVLDADALNILAFDPVLQDRLKQRIAPVLLTPHPAEAARLLDLQATDIQQNRIHMAQTLAQNYRAWVALKGCGTVIASPDGNWWINTTGNPGLATAGSGDVLTGMVVALLGQKWPPLEALLGACHLHGMAADHLLHQGIGPIGLCAGELADAARCCLNQHLSPNLSIL